jgi:hypothetical protein
MPGFLSKIIFSGIPDVAVWILAPAAAHDSGPQPPQAESSTLFPVRAAEARRGVLKQRPSVSNRAGTINPHTKDRVCTMRIRIRCNRPVQQSNSPWTAAGLFAAVQAGQ